MELRGIPEKGGEFPFVFTGVGSMVVDRERRPTGGDPSMSSSRRSWSKVILAAALGVTAAMFAAQAAAVPALAQQGPVTATGVLVGPVEDNTPGPTPDYRLTAQATGVTYVLVSGFVDLAPFAGQWVAVAGTPIGGADHAPPAVNVTRIESAEGPGNGGTVTATFELAVECRPPAGTRFAGSIGRGPAASGALLDQDGDGVYATTLPVERGTEQGARIEWLDPISDEPQAPLEATTITDFGAVAFDEDKTFSAGVSFCAHGDVGSPDGWSAGGERVVGTDGPDRLSGTRDDDLLRGGYGDDLLRGFDGADLLVGGAGADEVYGGRGDDALYAAYDAPTDEVPNAPASHDLLYGGEGDDFVDATDAPGAFDTVYCGPGGDLVEADAEDFVAEDCEEVIRF